MFLYILLAFAVLFILAQAWLIWVYVKRIDVLSRAYDSLDQGMTEITDAYETDSLQYEDTIAALNTQIEFERRQNQAHQREISMLNGKNTEQGKAIDGLHRQLDIAQTIISEHDLNCLPHIVLSHMEAQQDTPLPMDCESVEF